MPGRILLIEDEAGLVETLTDRLVASGYEVEVAANGRAGLELATGSRHDLLILDLMLPVMDGIDVCRNLRTGGVWTPILMLTAKARLEDKLYGFKAGADDYLTKPFEVAELLARVEALLRRRTDWIEGQPVIHFGPNCLDTALAEVRRNGEPVRLSVKEYNLLHYFLLHPGEVLSREVLLRDVWHQAVRPPTRTVDVHVGWLRQKIEDDPQAPRWIRTVHGVGYRFGPR